MILFVERTESMLIGSAKVGSKRFNSLDLELLLQKLVELLKTIGLIAFGAFSFQGIFGGDWGLIPFALSWIFALNKNIVVARCLFIGGLIGLYYFTNTVFSCLIWLMVWFFLEFIIYKKVQAQKTLVMLPALLYPLCFIIGRGLAFPLITFASYTLILSSVMANFAISNDIIKQRDRLWRAEEFFNVLVSAIMIAATLNYKIIGISLEHILLTQIVLISGLMGGVIWGIVAGALASLFVGNVTASYFLFLIGTLAGVLPILKASHLFCLLLGIGVMCLGRDFAFYGIEIIIASLFLPVLLKKVNQFKFCIPAISPQEKTESRAIELRARIEKFANTLSELSVVFAGMPIEKTDDDKCKLPSLVEGIAGKVCLNCSRQRMCWQESFLFSYGKLTELLVDLENEALVEAMMKKATGWCIQPREIVETAVSLWQIRGMDIVWQKRLIESKSVVANQLKGLSLVVGDLGCQLDLLEKDKHCADILGFELKKRNIDFNSLECNRFEQGKAISISLKKRNGKCLEKEIKGLVSQVIGEEYIIEKHLCKEEYCEFYLAPKYLYDIDIFVQRRPAEGYSLCGDSFGIASIARGRHLITLSDGMGVGPEAALQSSTVVSFMEKFILLGVPSQEALKLVNSVSFLSSERESFATVDLALLDKYTGTLSLYKMGAAPSYFKRGKKIITIASDSLPVGMLSSIDIHEKKTQLRPQDILVIVSDGVINEGHKITKNQEWLEKLLMESTGAAKEIGERIFSVLPLNNKDDLTALVLEIKLT